MIKQPDRDIHITSEKEVTVDFIVDEANVMWKEMKSRNILFGDSAAASALMIDMRRGHPEFCKAYPIVTRYICEMQEYSEKGFRRWLTKIKYHPWKTQDEYLDAQADYVTMLYRVKNPRASRRDYDNVRKNIGDALRNEHEEFKQRVDEYDREVTAELDKLKSASTLDLEAFFKKMGLPGLSAAEILRVETDLKSIEPRADNFNKLLSKTESYDNKMAVSASDLLC